MPTTKQKKGEEANPSYTKFWDTTDITNNTRAVEFNVGDARHQLAGAGSGRFNLGLPRVCLLDLL